MWEQGTADSEDPWELLGNHSEAITLKLVESPGS